MIGGRAAAQGLALASTDGIATQQLAHQDFVSREAYEAELAGLIDAHDPDWVVLAGFMRVLTPPFVARYLGRMVNIHPSLLPSFPGLETHRRALAAGVKIHGATVHFVSPGLDDGPIIAQAAVPVRPDDDETTLAARVLTAEHRLYPMVVRWLIEGRARLLGDQVQWLPSADGADLASSPADDAQLIWCP